MAAKYAKMSFRSKTQDCQYCQYRSSWRIPNTDIVVHFCTADLPKKVYQLRGHAVSSCKLAKQTV
ncbi:hypothetical protein JOC37_000464 [Desulfohalotomaculum tongense]|uniref:hypothetical protein n=1 Tax=Desulforadius tongensis TaxID=1216062 RepID=UPI00195B19D0|nr:hypothetical protein [Desulforadius tongensis]MBM7854092.1 hypothetical protein [Desulforadius tongensis]